MQKSSHWTHTGEERRARRWRSHRNWANTDRQPRNAPQECSPAVQRVHVLPITPQGGHWGQGLQTVAITSQIHPHSLFAFISVLTARLIQQKAPALRLIALVLKKVATSILLSENPFKDDKHMLLTCKACWETLCRAPALHKQAFHCSYNWRREYGNNQGLLRALQLLCKRKTVNGFPCCSTLLEAEMCTEVENYLSLPARALYYFPPLCQGGDLLDTDLKKALSIETDCVSLENS